MPSSGSMTSRSASSTSATSATAVAPSGVPAASTGVGVGSVLSVMTSFSLARLDQRIPQRHPSQQRALDAGRVLRHPREGGGVAEPLLGGGVERGAAAVHEVVERRGERLDVLDPRTGDDVGEHRRRRLRDRADRKSTRLNSSHVKTSYAVFCLKQKLTHLHYR